MVDETFESYALDAPINSVYPSGQTFTASADAAHTGTRGARRVLSDTAAYIRRDIESASGRQVCRVEFRYPGAPPAAALLLAARNRTSGDVGIGGVQILSTGLTQAVRGHTSTAIIESRPAATPFSGAGWYAIEMYHDPTGAGGLAHLGYRILDEDDTVLHEWTSPSTYDVGHDGPTTAWRIGGIMSSQWASAYLDLDNLRCGPQESGWVGPIPEAPDLDLEDLGPFHIWRASEVDGGTFTVDHLTGPDNSAGLIEFPIGGKAYFALPRGASTSTYDLEVSTSGGATNETLVVPASASSLVSGSVRRRVWNGSELL